jgi:cell division protein ZapE
VSDGPLHRYRALKEAGSLNFDPMQELAAEKLQALHHALGGYTDTQAALKSGLLKKLLAAHQISLADGPRK